MKIVNKSTGIIILHIVSIVTLYCALPPLIKYIFKISDPNKISHISFCLLLLLILLDLIYLILKCSVLNQHYETLNKEYKELENRYNELDKKNTNTCKQFNALNSDFVKEQKISSYYSSVIKDIKFLLLITLQKTSISEDSCIQKIINYIDSKNRSDY